MREDTRVEPSQHATRRGALDPEQVRHKRWADVKPRVRRAQQKPEIVRREVGVMEGRREAVELLPVGFVDQVAHLLPQWRARIGREDLELGERRAELNRVIDGLRDRVPGVLKKPEYIERRRGD